MKEFKQVYEKKDNKIVEKTTESGRVLKTKRALVVGDIVKNEKGTFEEVVLVQVDEVGGITMFLKSTV